ncbi:hypothetical protein [Ruegeria sp. HKCCD7318]|uniref:hypothetical protein n=1 Tax=Ruegeria sp. HKCCD7318 TaxID=2683014 RepID=UPI00149211D7|nr:hypothetical protein [Ruegeria sp. HKCCD7318]NOE36106.1 hypothetical protein [Ruegeria sp. HKCCD7318]
MSRIVDESYRAYEPRPFTADQRKDVTLLFGGVTWRAEKLLEGLFRSAGYNAERLPDATVDDLFLGRELADVGQCCPTAFTTGNLSSFLKSEAERVGAEKVSEKYVYVTAGACGACRFGQYHQSYELALKNLGLEAFRMILVQQHEIDQSKDKNVGLQTDIHLLLSTALGMMAADAIQDLEYQLRPYEVEEGASNRAAQKAVSEIYEAMLSRPKDLPKLRSIWWHSTTRHFLKAMRRARRRFEGIELDRLRVKPMVKITGEFYLATAEGVQNYNMHKWLEDEGAEVQPAPMVVWFDYLMRYGTQKLALRFGIKERARQNYFFLKLGQRFFRFKYDEMRRMLGGIPRPMPGQDELRKLAAPFFDNMINGGEGDLLIAKAIWAHTQKKAHMICELSPYGCLPNTMSIGAMAAVQGKYPDMLYAPIEVKGDSDVHALSRCQMVLADAKNRAQEEFRSALAAAGLTLEEARKRAREHPKVNLPFWKVPHRGAVGTASNVVLEIGNATL